MFVPFSKYSFEVLGLPYFKVVLKERINSSNISVQSFKFVMVPHFHLGALHIHALRGFTVSFEGHGSFDVGKGRSTM